MRRLSTALMLAALFVCLGLEALPNTAHAQTGKLAGLVTESDNGDPLPGTTVLLEETGQGTAADAQGRYTIIGITPGVYRVRFSFVGFSTTVIENVRVTSDRTTTLDMALSTTAVGGGEVVVVAERPVVDPNQTTSRSLVSKEEIQRLPVGTLEDVISSTSNSYKGFVRGSRRFETKTIIEGIDISDSFYSLSQGAGATTVESTNYGTANRLGETSASIMDINPEGVEEVTVNTGATGAQYAAGSGGVVAVTLAEGRGPIRGSFSARVSPSISAPGPDSLGIYRDAADYFADLDGQRSAADPNQAKIALYSWDEQKYAMGDDPEFDVRFNLGGSITDKWTFSTSGQFFQTNGYLPNYFRRRVNGQLKSSYMISANTRLTAVGIIDDQGRWGNWNNRNYTELFRFNLESVAQNDIGSYIGSLKLTQIFSPTSYLDVQVYRTFNQVRYGYPDDNGNGFTEVGEKGDFIDFRDPNVVSQYIGISNSALPPEQGGRDEVNDPRMFIDIVTDSFSESGIFLPNGRRYRLGRPSPFSESRLSATNAFKADYTNQVTYNHLLRTGFEFKLRTFELHSVNGSTGPGVYLNDVNEPFRVNDYERKPWELALYIADRMEYAGLIVNAGLRVEIIDRDAQQINDYFYPFQADTITVAGNQLARHYFDRGDDVPIDVLWNPSIGISHPIGSKASMYFSYARSQQLLPYNELYLNYDGNHSNNRFLSYANPAQDPVTSNNFELGLQWEVYDGWGVDVNAYARSIDNYGRVNFVANNRTPDGSPVLGGLTQHTYRTNFGYADSRGIELVLRRQPREVATDVTLGLTASYTFSTVEEGRVTGQNTNTFAFDETTGDTSLPFENANDFQNFPQNVEGGSVITGGFDRRHRGIVRAVAGLPYDISLGLLTTLESGFLYQKAVDFDPRDRELLTAPTNFQIDLRLEKRFQFNQGLGADVFLDVTNLTNRNNVVAYDQSIGADVVFQQTGVPGERLILADGSPLYGRARTIYFGSRIRF